VWPFTKSDRKQLNDLETRLERLETRDTETRIQVLTLAEKVLHRLNARVSKREKEAVEETVEEPEARVVNPLLAARRRLRGF
jgi:hypothetical protein